MGGGSAEPRRRAWTLFGVLSALYVLSMFYRVSTALIAVDLARELRLGAEQLSALGAAFFYAFAFAQIPLGPALDRWGAKRIVASATAVGAAGAFLFAAGRGLPALLLARALMGVGMAPVLMGSLKLFTGWFPPGAFGTVSGLIMALGGLGAMLAATPLAGLVAWLGWRATFGLFGAVTLAGTAATILLVHDAPAGPGRGGPPPGGLFAGLGQVARQPNFRAMAPLALVGYASLVSLQGLWAGPFFMEALGYSRAVAGNILLALGLAGAVGTALAGWLSDRVLRTRKWVVVGGALPAALLMVPLLGPGAPATPAGWTLLFAGVGLLSAGRSLVYVHAKESLPPELTGTAVTAVNFFIMVGPALMQQAMGRVLAARPGDYAAAFLIPVAGLAAGSLVYAFTRDTHPASRR